MASHFKYGFLLEANFQGPLNITTRDCTKSEKNKLFFLRNSEEFDVNGKVLETIAYIDGNSIENIVLELFANAPSQDNLFDLFSNDCDNISDQKLKNELLKHTSFQDLNQILYCVFIACEQWLSIEDGTTIVNCSIAFSANSTIKFFGLLEHVNEVQTDDSKKRLSLNLTLAKAVIGVLGGVTEGFITALTDAQKAGINVQKLITLTHTLKPDDTDDKGDESESCSSNSDNTQANEDPGSNQDQNVKFGFSWVQKMQDKSSKPTSIFSDKDKFEWSIKSAEECDVNGDILQKIIYNGNSSIKNIILLCSAKNVSRPLRIWKLLQFDCEKISLHGLKKSTLIHLFSPKRVKMIRYFSYVIEQWLLLDNGETMADFRIGFLSDSTLKITCHCHHMLPLENNIKHLLSSNKDVVRILVSVARNFKSTLKNAMACINKIIPDDQKDRLPVVQELIRLFRFEEHLKNDTTYIPQIFSNEKTEVWQLGTYWGEDVLEDLNMIPRLTSKQDCVHIFNETSLILNIEIDKKFFKYPLLLQNFTTFTENLVKKPAFQSVKPEFIKQLKCCSGNFLLKFSMALIDQWISKSSNIKTSCTLRIHISEDCILFSCAFNVIGLKDLYSVLWQENETSFNLKVIQIAWNSILDTNSWSTAKATIQKLAKEKPLPLVQSLSIALNDLSAHNFR